MKKLLTFLLFIPLVLFSFDYESQWKKIEKLDQQQLPKSALKLTKRIYNKAKEEKNEVELIKSILYKGKYLFYQSEDAYVQNIYALEKELEKPFSFSTKLLLRSLLAEFYANYLDRNYYKIHRRTTVKNNDSPDMATWSVEQLIAKSTELYLTTLNPKSQNISMAKYQNILTKGEYVDGLYPTLYDFLAFRALKYFKNNRYSLHEANNNFKITNKNALTPASEFKNYPFAVNDSIKYNALLVYQKLLLFHQEGKYPKAVMHIDLERLYFVYNNLRTEDAKEAYENALKSIVEKHPDSEALYYLADFYVSANNYAQAMHYAKQGIKSKSTYTSKLCLAIQNSIEERVLHIQTELVNLPNEEILSHITYRNIEKLFVKVLKPNTKQLKELNTHKEQTDYLNSLKSFTEFNIDLPSTDDYQEHRTEYSLGSYDIGTYIFLFSDNASFSKNLSQQRVHVSNISYLKRDKKLLVLHRKSGKPLQDVQASFFRTNDKEQTLLFTEKSDKDGFISLPNNKERAVYKVVLKHKNDQINTFSRKQYYYDHNPDNAFNRVYFFTDRSIYGPNQKIYFKGLAINKPSFKKPKIITKQKVKVSFLNANHQTIKTKTFTTDEYGTFHGEFTIPASGKLGEMQLSSSLGGTQYIHVEEYKRPKFEVHFNKLTKSYKLGDKVTFTGEAKAYAGNGIANAKVKYSIKKETKYPWRYYDGHTPHSTGQTIKQGEVKSNDKGIFEISFDTLIDKDLVNKLSTYYYTVHVDISDSTGESHSTSKSIELGMVGIKVKIKMAEEFNVEENKTVKLKTTNLDGTFQALQGEIIINKVSHKKELKNKRYWNYQKVDKPIYNKNKFHKLFPNYNYLIGEEKQEALTVKSMTFDTGKSNILELGTLEQGEYTLTLKTTDENGIEVGSIKKFNIYDLKSQHPDHTTRLWQKTDKKSYAVGEDAVLHLKSSLENFPVLLSIQRGNKNIKEKWLTINGLKKALIKVEASDQGDIHYQLNYVHENRAYQEKGVIKVPWENSLKVEYLSFRDKLKPNEKEQWKIKISGQNKEKVMAQMVATMYDASLDALAVHQFDFPNLFPNYYHSSALNWKKGRSFSSAWLRQDWRLQKLENVYRVFQDIKYKEIDGQNKRSPRYDYDSYGSSSYPQSAMSTAKCGAGGDINPVTMFEQEAMSPKKISISNASSKEVKVRKNFNETMFFKPNLQTDEEGNIIIDFKTNEALTRWNFMAFVHTKDLKTAVTKKTLTTSKELMVVTNLPRFFREKDQISLSAKVVNMSEKDLNGTCELKLVDPVSEKPIFEREFKKNISIKKGASTVVEFKFTVPNVDEVLAIKHTIIAKTDTHSDAEQIIKPILSNRVFITESKNMFVKAHEEKSFTLESLKNNASTTLSNHKLTLEFTSNPAWYAIKSLPYLMEYPHACNEQLFNRYFANALASKIANSSPKIKKVFESWKSKGELISALETNKELKSVLLEETPWVLNAKSEAEQQANLGILFDLVRLAKEEKATYNKLIKRQFEHSDGGWAWFESPHSNWYITQYIVEGFGKLKKLGIDKTNTEAMGVATHYMDMQMLEQYQNLLKDVEEHGAKLEDDHLSSMLIHYLYARSFYSFNMDAKIQEAHNYYLEQSKKYWVNKGLYEQGMIALTLEAREEKNSALAIAKSLKERALVSDELGMYFKYTNGYYWNQMPIETHALMIDVFNTVSKDKQSVELMKTWLLKNKQTTHWKTTKATASAIYALLSDVKWIDNDKQVELSFDTTLPYKEKLEQAEVQAGTGYVKVDYKNFDKSMATVKVSNPNDSIAWGALYWQYFEEMDKVKNFKETPLTINKKLYLIEKTDKDEVLSPITNQELKIRDKVKVRIELRVDRDMEYIMLKDARASAFEPINVLSQYKYQDGLGYYESTKDNATYFFMDYLRKGTYVFEYPLVITHKGDFSNGITTIESMYAPEFKSHSEGVRVLVE